jgi:hypothetical protein
MSKTNNIPEEIREIMSYLAHTFAESMNDPVNSEEDLFNDMVVLYLENLEDGKVAKPEDKNQWFVFFKSRMINKYKRIQAKRKGLERLINESRI